MMQMYFALHNPDGGDFFFPEKGAMYFIIQNQQGCTGHSPDLSRPAFRLPETRLSLDASSSGILPAENG